MGLTYVDIEIAHPGALEPWSPVACLVDSGAIYSVIDARILQALGIQHVEEQQYQLADGTKIIRRKGGAAFRYQGRIGFADVIFGEEGDANLLGAFTLESLGLSLDPLRRELKPIPMMLARQDDPEE